LRGRRVYFHGGFFIWKVHKDNDLLQTDKTDCYSAANNL